MDALDDFHNLLRSHVQATKQEIQSLEISARMRSVASEVQDGASIHALDGGLEDPDQFQGLTQLTKQLSAVQAQTSELYERREQLRRQVDAKRLSAAHTPSHPSQSASATAKALNVSLPSAPVAAPLAVASPAAFVSDVSPSSSVTSIGGEINFSAAQEVRRSESVESAPAPADPFVFGVEATGPASDFSW